MKLELPFEFADLVAMNAPINTPLKKPAKVIVKRPSFVISNFPIFKSFILI